LTTDETGELTAPREHFVPNLHTLGFAQINVRDRAEISLKKLAASRQVEALERIC
jgi:hypothetical protein